MIRREIRPQYVTDTFQEMYDRVDARLTADSFLANRLQAHFIQCHNPVHRGGMIPRWMRIEFGLPQDPEAYWQSSAAYHKRPPKKDHPPRDFDGPDEQDPDFFDKVD